MSRFHSQVREVINRNTFVSLALKQGFNVYLPVYDDGVDFILDNERAAITRKVQLKARWTIDRKYEGRDIWIAFPIGDDWYLMPHEEMLKSAHVDGATKSKSWINGGLYSRPRLSAAALQACATYRFATMSLEDRLTWREGDIQIVERGSGKTLADLDSEETQ